MSDSFYDNCGPSPVHDLYPGRPMETTFDPTRKNISFINDDFITNEFNYSHNNAVENKPKSGCDAAKKYGIEHFTMPKVKIEKTIGDYKMLFIALFLVVLFFAIKYFVKTYKKSVKFSSTPQIRIFED